MAPYYSLNQYLLEKFHTKVYKIALNGNMSCPNRDGSIGHGGCIFCSEGGSGDFASDALLSVTGQIEAGKQKLSGKYKGSSYIAYFQAYTNTYAPIEYLESLFTEAVNHPDIVCLSVATRPDCLDKNKIALLSRLNKIKPVWVELGLQTIHETTAAYIRRGYDLSVFDHAMDMLNEAGIETIIHMIIGLPKESESMMLDTARYIGRCGAKGIKLQLLHVLKNTALAADYENGSFQVLSLEEYTHTVMEIIKILPKDMVIHRLTGDGPKKLLIAPSWSADKKNVLNTLNRAFSTNNIMQGSDFAPY